MAAENGFLIAGKVYEVPTLDSFDLNEAELMYEQCELLHEDFAQEEGETDEEHGARIAKLMRRPGFLASLAQIAYQRGNPSLKPAQVRQVLGKTNRLELFSTLEEEKTETEDVPLALTSEPSESSGSGSLESENSARSSSESSGSGSENGSDDLAGEVVSIGTTRSDTSSTSVPETSVVSGLVT